MGQQRKKRSFLSYILLLIITGMLAVILMNTLSSIRDFNLYSQYKNNQRLSKLSYALVDQQANLLAVMMKNNSSADSLSSEMKSFSKNSFISNASLYKSDGSIIAQTNPSTNIRSQLINTAQQNADNNMQIVKPLVVSNKVLGFLRVTFNLEDANNTAYQSNKPLLNLYALYIIIMLTVAFYIGTLVAFFAPTAILTKNNKELQS